uniref:Uncharacterized protein n=1 Tax=Bursaphelenchus xylophilus TaxID=6326 RepID=A0A1I7S2G9_BURXY
MTLGPAKTALLAFRFTKKLFNYNKIFARAGSKYLLRYRAVLTRTLCIVFDISFNNASFTTPSTWKKAAISWPFVSWISTTVIE